MAESEWFVNACDVSSMKQLDCCDAIVLCIVRAVAGLGQLWRTQKHGCCG